MTDYIAAYRAYLSEEKRASANTLSSYIRDLTQFQPKDIKAELGKTQKAFKEITARVSDELYRQRAERSKEQER